MQSGLDRDREAGGTEAGRAAAFSDREADEDVAACRSAGRGGEERMEGGVGTGTRRERVGSIPAAPYR